MRDSVTLFCLIRNQKTKSAFAVQIDRTETFHVLKQHIVRKNKNYFGKINPQQLRLWKVSIKSGDESCPYHKWSNELQPTWTINKAFPTEPPEEEIHIYIKAPHISTFFFFYHDKPAPFLMLIPCRRSPWWATGTGYPRRITSLTEAGVGRTKSLTETGPGRKTSLTKTGSGRKKTSHKTGKGTGTGV